MPRPMTLPRRITVALAAWAGAAVLRALAMTWRISWSGSDLPREHFDRREPFIGVFWHNRILGLLWTTRHRDATTLISRHRDGEIIARIAQRFGHRTARGSSTRGAVGGFKGLLDAAASGTVGITPDGPRGPVYRFQPGGAELALRTGRPVVVVACAADRAWRAGSWDRFIVPKPFARLLFRSRLVPLPRAPDGAPAPLEDVRLLLEKELRDVTREAEEELTGTHDERLDAPAAGAPGEAATRGSGRRSAVVPERPAGRLVGAVALAAGVLTAALPHLLPAGVEAGQDGRAGLAAALLLASGFATALGPPAALAAGARGAALVGAGLLLGTFAEALPAGRALLGPAAEGMLYPLALLLLGGSLARLLSGLRAAPLLAALPGAGFLLSIFAAGPLLSLAHDPGRPLALLLRASAVTALTGSLLDVDVLRAAPLYQLVPAASEAPFRYPEFTTALAAPGALALALAALALWRGKSGRSP